ncbi:DNA cytosine methyltransferase [Pseudomonas aeruginosa]|uniref:DNA cytosine methyltransferase n=1 Tax=Pseudomonas aeruginosa TaxID=287 RepID=UPI00305CE9E7|nr:DNA cytosine methyltransferase [Pseudomonas aeruginosa]EKY1399629.1 DNA cytosine methyltransferase [Pseudomonas aeruginosa]
MKLTTTAYYNEIDPYAAQWLRNLIAAGHIAPGDVDERSIEDVHPDDLKHYTQCHFFAGIGVWSLSLRRAGWPDDRPVWTGSCPCQPYSKAGKRLGFADPRHLWPSWSHLIRERRPPELFGEQSPEALVHGWFDLVQGDLEEAGYAAGAIHFAAASCGEPILRKRVYFAAKHLGEGAQGQQSRRSPCQAGSRRWRGEEDLRAIADSPLQPGDRWPQPIVRSLDHGYSCRMGALHAIGNALNAEAATQFIAAYMEAA